MKLFRAVQKVASGSKYLPDKFILVILMLFNFNFAISQDYEKVEASIALYPKNVDKPEDLSRFISRDFASEEEKVRAIYTWLIKNISYDPEEYKKFDYSFKNYRERNEKDEKLRNKIIERTLQTGKAVCEGYAMTFEKLCELQGIQNYLVRGDTKSNFPDIGRPFKKSHMWNIIYIDGRPYLFDATWGAGKYNGKFIKEPTYFYYKTAPEVFIRSHYPDIFGDAFVNYMMSREEFANRPLIINRNLEPKDIEFPLKGILYEEDYYGEILFSVRNISPETVSYSYGNEIKKIDEVVKESGRIQFKVPLTIGGENLLVYFDGKPALGYVIK